MTDQEVGLYTAEPDYPTLADVLDDVEEFVRVARRYRHDERRVQTRMQLDMLTRASNRLTDAMDMLRGII